MSGFKNPGVMCPGLYYRPPHPGGAGACVHCGKVTGAWCASCRVFVCSIRFTQGDSGCDGLHQNTCRSQEERA
jgi:hypothetical protein